jgi:hypothetical protein
MKGTVRPRGGQDGALRHILACFLALAAGPALAQEPAAAATPAPATAPAPVAPTAPTPLQTSSDGTAPFEESVIESLPDPARLGPAEVVYVNPLFRPIETQARLVERPVPTDWEGRATLVLTLHVNETGKVVEGTSVQTPLKGLDPAIKAMISRWTFQPAKKGGVPVATWATMAIDLQVQLEKGTFSSFLLTPIGKDDPLPLVARDSTGDAWTARYPKEISPKDSTVVSVEDLDVAPVPQKTSWDFDATRWRSRVNALIEVASNGVVRRIVPIGNNYESAVFAWVRQMAPRWKLSPALAGKPSDSWAVLDATLEYTIDAAKDKGKRMIKKNLRATPTD